MKIFISYSETDKGIVEKIESQLKNFGFTVLRDKEFLKTGDWEQQIDIQIKECDSFLVVVTLNSIKSSNVTGEVLKAQQFNKAIIPLNINGAPNFPILEKLQHYKYTGDFSNEEIYKMFNISLSELVSRDEMDIISNVNHYKAKVKKDHNKFSILNQGKTAPIEKVYVDCSLQYGMEFDEYNDSFPSSQLIGEFDGGMFIITGHPGTGKTSLMNYLAYRLSGRELNYFPIYVHLKNYSPNFISFEDFISASTGGIIKKFGLEMLTHRFNCVLLLDGLDETAPEAYSSLKEEINKMCVQYPLLTIVVTTRINGFKNDRENDYSRAKLCTIAPLDETIIEEYINLWFEKKDKELADTLYRIILSNSKFLELAEKAIFMLCLMCIVFECEKELTSNVSSLYSKAIRHLLDTRRGIIAQEKQLRTTVLKVIALRFLQMQQRVFDGHLTEAIVQSTISDKSLKSANGFLSDLIDDTGLLQGYDGKYSFTHLTFQEFFVAQAVMDSQISFNEENLLDFANIGMWEETFKLYVALLESDIEKENFLKSLSDKNLSLALRVAIECGDLGTKVLKDVIQKTHPSEKLRMLEEVKNSLHSLNINAAKKLVIETLDLLIQVEKNSTVLYYSIQLLKEYDADDSSMIMYNNFYKYQNEKFNELINDKSYSFELISIPSGEFIMGNDDSIDYNEKPAHKVHLDTFMISKYQLSNKSFEFIMNLDTSHRHQQYSSGDNQPVINVDWFDAYICALRIGCRLPTEAEWEYAARATTTTQWCFGDNESEIIKYAHCYESKAEKTRDVTEGLPNKWGLVNVHGNVWEWCNDWFEKYLPGDQFNPIGPNTGELRVRRGGGWLYHARGCKSSFRYGNEPNYKYNDIGIRLAKGVK